MAVKFDVGSFAGWLPLYIDHCLTICEIGRMVGLACKMRMFAVSLPINLAIGLHWK